MNAVDLANVDELVAAARSAWRPPPRLKLSEWADERFYLSAESAADPGRWHTLPYQREPMDASPIRASCTSR
jgi:phage terminase large subunit GpA-like protein